MFTILLNFSLKPSTCNNLGKKFKKVVDIYRYIGYSKQVDREHP